MNWLARFEITAAMWLVIPLTGMSGAERASHGDPQSKWSSQQEADRMIVHYFDRRIREKAADLRAQYSPERFAQESDKVRRSLRATYLAPSTLWDGQSQLIREATIDGLSLYPGIEMHCFSGSTLVEKDRVIAIYHGTTVGNMVAVSNDPLLLNWEKLSGNPVIPIAPLDEQTGRTYEVGRKVAKDFKANMTILVDDLIPNWNYRAVPQ